jgi:hypothetical protein
VVGCEHSATDVEVGGQVPGGSSPDQELRTDLIGRHGPGLAALVKPLARAWRWQKLLDEGVFTSVSEIGDAEKISTSYVSRILRLALLAPDMVESNPRGDGRSGAGAGEPGAAAADGLVSRVSFLRYPPASADPKPRRLPRATGAATSTHVERVPARAWRASFSPFLVPQHDNEIKLSPQAARSLSAPSGGHEDRAPASGSVASGFERTIISRVADHRRMWRLSDLQAA